MENIDIQSILWALWFLFALVWLVVTIMFQFHWTSYAKGELVIWRTAILYYAGSILILGCIALLIASL